MVVKIDKKQLKMVEDETFDDISIEDLAQGMLSDTSAAISAF